LSESGFCFCFCHAVVEDDNAFLDLMEGEGGMMMDDDEEDE
jgi:hypothetical protein